jgi:UPF0755 protein
MTASPLRIFIAVSVWLLIMAGIAAFYLWSWLQTPHTIPKDQQSLVIARGESLNQVAQRLYRSDIIRWPKAWTYYARLFDPEPIKAGEYNLPEYASPQDILNQLQVGEVVTHQLTFVEGRTFADMLNVLHGVDNLEHKLKGLSNQEIIAKLGLNIEHPEGWFFPDTYHYVSGDTDTSILRRAHRRMQNVLELEWRARAVGLPYDSPYEALIMASIIEKETGVPHERDEIAGVFVRRLELGMRLQTDPTVIYGLGAAFDGNLRRQDLKAPTPYNTYTTNGLPPTPIAMPGRDAIRAALHPKEGDALYFVARGDGSHYFSATLEEHAEAVRRFQKQRRRPDYRSSPATVAPSAEKSVEGAEPSAPQASGRDQ